MRPASIWLGHSVAAGELVDVRGDELAHVKGLASAPNLWDVLALGLDDAPAVLGQEVTLGDALDAVDRDQLEHVLYQSG